MAATLPGLPTELLLHIIEMESEQPIQRHLSKNGSTLPMQQRLFAALRATCAEIDIKLSHFFAAKHLTKIKASLSQTGISYLETIAKQWFCSHVQTIWINADSLFAQRFYEYTSDAADASRCSWYGSAAYNDMDIQYCKCTFDEGVADFIADGSCGRMLRAVLSSFQNLKCLWIIIPMVNGEVVEEKLQAIQSRWAMASQVLFDVVLTDMPTLQEFAVKKVCTWYRHPVPLPLSTMDAVALRDPVWIHSLRKLDLRLINYLQEGS